MTDVGLDWAWVSPNLDEVWAAGYRFVSRYLSYDTTGKNLTPTELAALRAHGFEVAANWEWYAQDQLGGAPAGTQHATDAVSQAEALGYSKGCTIYFSADFDATEAQQATINAYMTAAGAVVHAAGYRIGIYGGYWVVSRAFDAGVTDDGWQTYAWSGGAWEPRAAIRQDQNGITVGGAQVDHNTRVGQTYLMGQSTVEDEVITHLWKDTTGQTWHVTGPLQEKRPVSDAEAASIRYYAGGAQGTLKGWDLVDMTHQETDPAVIPGKDITAATATPPSAPVDLLLTLTGTAKPAA